MIRVGPRLLFWKNAKDGRKLPSFLVLRELYLTSLPERPISYANLAQIALVCV
jgi:hypothetical protein